jgi:cyanophycinase
MCCVKEKVGWRGLALLTAALFLNPALRAAEPRAQDLPGALVIVGGGGLPPAIRDCFLQLAGGKKARLVVIPTASARFEATGVSLSYNFWKSQDVASVVLLHAHQRAEADRPEFVRPLTQATGVWLAGGDQSRLAAAYHGTAVEKELLHVLARGGVIGGTSAGASIMGSLMITGGNPAARVGEGFGLLPAVVIDQHFSQRNRLDRLLGVLAGHPGYVGLGIDENTAVVLQGHTLRVLGDQTVRVCLPQAGRAGVRVLKAGASEAGFDPGHSDTKVALGH